MEFVGRHAVVQSAILVGQFVVDVEIPDLLAVGESGKVLIDSVDHRHDTGRIAGVVVTREYAREDDRGLGRLLAADRQHGFHPCGHLHDPGIVISSKRLIADVVGAGEDDDDLGLHIVQLAVVEPPEDVLNGVAAPANVRTEGDTFNQRLNYARNRVIVVDLWTDTNDWAACSDPRMYPTIGLAFRYGRSPEIFSVASPTAGLMFTNDTMPIKARFFFAVGPVDYRGLYKANVT